ETIADLAEAGITDLDGMNADQVQSIFEMFATNAIEARLCNDIGAKTVTMPPAPADASRVQAQLHDIIRRGVSDALTAARAALEALTPDRVLAFVDRIYEQAFEILQAIGEDEAEAEAA